MEIKSTLIGFVVLASLISNAQAQFTPGNVFVSETAGHFCTKISQYGSDRIYEIDPKTGESWIFADIPDELCGTMTGLVFTPDGARLRASSAGQSAIFEFDSAGNMSVAYDFSDGIAGPSGRNNLAYDSAGNFYVGNGNQTILRLPVDGGPATVYADESDGVGLLFALALASDGDLYWGTLLNNINQVRRITPEGTVSSFDTFGGIISAVTMVADEDNSIYVIVETGELLVYESGDSTTKEVLTTLTRAGSLAMMPDQSKMYYAQFGSLHTIDLVNGDMTLVADVHDLSDPRGRGGVAVVPTVPSDLDRDADVDIDDHTILTDCLSGPGVETDLGACPRADIDKNGAIDLGDFAMLQDAYTGEVT